MQVSVKGVVLGGAAVAAGAAAGAFGWIGSKKRDEREVDTTSVDDTSAQLSDQPDGSDAS